MPPIFSTTTITHFRNTGEASFAMGHPCIVDRISIALVAAQPLYVLPSYVTNIRRVTYLGWKVYPLPHRDLRASYISGTQQSRPYWYIFNNVGQNTIRMFPVPSVDLALGTGDLWGNAILGCFIIEFYRIPDQSTFFIPQIFRQRLLKCYVNKRSFEIDGKGVKLKNRDYWNQKWEFLKSTYGELLNDLMSRPRRLVANGQSGRPYGFLPPPPILPVNRFGIGVDEIN